MRPDGLGEFVLQAFAEKNNDQSKNTHHIPT